MSTEAGNGGDVDVGASGGDCSSLLQNPPGKGLLLALDCPASLSLPTLLSTLLLPI